jgi:apolipoprotein N-acyltransferase
MGALLTSALFVLTLPPFDFVFAIYIALIPLFVVTVYKKNTTQVVIESWLIGLTIGLYAYLGALFESPWLYLLCISVISFVFAAIGFISAQIVQSKSRAKFVFLGLVWALPEVVFEAIDLPFSFAVGLVNHIGVLQPASYIGVKGVVILLFISQAWLALLLKDLSQRHQGMKAGLGLFVYAMVLVTWQEIGLLIERESKENTTVVDHVIAAQTAFEPELLDLVGLPGNIERISRDVDRLISKIEKYPRDYSVFWPESVLPGVPIQIENDIVKAIYGLNRRQVIHAYGVNHLGDTESRAWLIDGEGNKLDSYAKSSPVPFVEEYKAAETLPRPLVGAHRNLGVLICNDSSFLRNYKNFVEKKSDYVVVLTNDAYAGPSILAHIHLAVEQIRAIESGLAIVRAANGGPSAIIGVTGRIEQMLSLFETGIVSGPIEKLNRINFYVQYSDIILLIYWGVLLLFTIQWVIQRRKREKESGSTRAYGMRWHTLSIASAAAITLLQFYTLQSQYIRTTSDVNTDNIIMGHVSAVDFITRDLGFIASARVDQERSGSDILQHLIDKEVIRRGKEQPPVQKKFKHEYGLLKTKLGYVVLLQDNEGKILLYSEESGGIHKTNFDRLKRLATSSVTWIGVTVKNSDIHIY